MVHFKSTALVALLAIYVSNAKTKGDFPGGGPGRPVPGGPHGRHASEKESKCILPFVHPSVHVLQASKINT
jgi:hypothetical protein